MPDTLKCITRHVNKLRQCTRCKNMIRPVVTGQPVVSPVMLIGQAPGDKEGPLGKPFAWTAGKTMFKWFSGLGIEEERFRESIYMAAVCRCFPGKNPKGGDRVPSDEEIAHCAEWMDAELEILKPGLIIPVGKLAISQFMRVDKLKDVIGATHALLINNRKTDIIPLPHPSGASTWHRMEPGKSLLEQALHQLSRHPAWQQVRNSLKVTS